MEEKTKRTMTRGTSPAVSAILLITVALGAIVAAAAHLHQSGSIASKNIQVAIESVSFSKARSDSDVWLFSMNLRNTGTMPVTISGTVTGTSVNQSIDYYGTLDPGSRGAMSYVWTVGAIPGEKYFADLTITGGEGSTRRQVIEIVADG